MSSMIQSAQQRAALDAESCMPSSSNIATVSAVSADGITLVLPGESTAGSKLYPYNAACTFAAGQRVHIARESGTIIVEYPIGGGK